MDDTDLGPKIEPFNGMPQEDADLLNMACTMALARLYDDGELRPFTLMNTHDLGIFYPCLEAFDEAGKNKYAACVRALSIKHRVQRLVYVSEAWIVRLNTSEEQKKFEAWRRKNPDGSFGDYEGRVEVIMLSIESQEGTGLLSLAISRSPDGAPYVSSEELERPRDNEYSRRGDTDAKKMEVSGRFVNMLALPSTWDDPRAVALANMVASVTGIQSDIITEEMVLGANEALKREGKERRRSVN